MMSYRLLIFDLDGTLINSVGDLATATNHALEAFGYPTHATQEYRYFVGNGLLKLLERALPDGEKTSENIERLKRLFIPYYTDHGYDCTVVYDGITDLLMTLQARNISLAVASNKYHQATVAMVKHFFPQITFQEIFGQREGVATKPDPTIVFDILAATGVLPKDTLYIGDTGVDMQTAINAGIDAVGVTWGFRPQTELEPYRPKYLVDHPCQILDIIDKIAQ